MLQFLKACGITIPVETCGTERETYMSHFGQWSQLVTSEVRNPWFALELFIREFMNEDTVSEIRNNTQDALDFFRALAGENLVDLNAVVEFFSFMRPTTDTRITVETCLNCGRETGESKQTITMF